MAFDSQGYTHYRGAACDGVEGSKQTHMGGYVEQHLAQSTNGRPIEEDAHTVDDSDLILMCWDIHESKMRMHPTAIVQNY